MIWWCIQTCHPEKQGTLHVIPALWEDSRRSNTWGVRIERHGRQRAWLGKNGNQTRHAAPQMPRQKMFRIKRAIQLMLISEILSGSIAQLAVNWNLLYRFL